MPSWNQVLEEMQTCKRIDALDYTRRKYLSQLHEKTGRNVIAYYSGWLQKPGIGNSSIQDDDKNGFMAAIHNLKRENGLDLILHTPGGDLAATESIVDYLRRMFGTNIRAIIPQLAMSAGTMISCACREILMGKQSNIGPIDPQFNGIPAHGVIAEFKRAIEEIKKDPQSIPIWQVLVSKYHPTFIGECQNAIDLSSEIVNEWLKTGMFCGESDSVQKALSIISHLNNHDETKTHARHIHIDEAIEMGLKIVQIENDHQLQDIILTIHHSYMHTFSNSNAIKIVENHIGNAVVYNALK
jgi:hypothetical protein